MGEAPFSDSGSQSGSGSDSGSGRPVEGAVEPGSGAAADLRQPLQLVGREAGPTTGGAAATGASRGESGSGATGSPAGTDRPKGPQGAGAGDRSGRSPGAEVDRETPRRWVVPVWLLVVVVAVFSAALIWQVREARDLAARVDGLEDQLADSRARVIAQRRHLQAVRAGVHGLADRVQALRTLVDEGPDAAPTAGSDVPSEAGAPRAGTQAASPRIPARLESR